MTSTTPPLRPSLFGMTFTELQQYVIEKGLPKFKAKQLADWLYKKNVSEWSAMTNLSQTERTMLSALADLWKPHYTECLTSADGTKKYLFPTVGTSHTVETVFIPSENRNTLCVSSQAGCKMACCFCMTGQQGFGKHLSTAEILSQVYCLPEFESLTNIVFMGMGEPLDNMENVIKAIEILTSDYGLAWSPTRITLSTIGIIKHLRTIIEQTKVHLAISLHSPFAIQRAELVPAERTNPVTEIIKILKEYTWYKQRRLSFEYTLFDNVNDSTEHAEALAVILKHLPCRINLINYHPVAGSSLRPSGQDKVLRFKTYLEHQGFTTTLRTSRGEDILAACGMLGKVNG